jgi:hypothetical protein
MDAFEKAEFKALCEFHLRWINGDQSQIFWEHDLDRLLELARRAAELI